MDCDENISGRCKFYICLSREHLEKDILCGEVALAPEATIVSIEEWVKKVLFMMSCVLSWLKETDAIDDTALYYQLL